MEGFGSLMNMFAPQPGMDPFAFGSALATNPESATKALATMGPPPAQGQGFMDWLGTKLGGPGNAPPSETGAPMIPPPAMPPRTPMPGGTPSAAGVGQDLSNAFSAAFPGAGARMGRETPTGMDLAGDQPSPFAPGAPGTQPPPIPGGLQTAAAPPPTQGAQPDILAPLTSTPAASPSPPMTPETMKKVQEAAKGLSGGLLAGVKGLAPPATQHISSPSIPRPAAGGNSNITALIQALTQGGAGGPAGTPLRLGNALYAGGRGLY